MSYIKVIILGGMGSTEVWSCSTSWRNFELFPATMTQTMIESLATRIKTNVSGVGIGTALRSLISNQGEIRGFRVEQHGEDEKLTNVAESFYAGPSVGTGSPSKTPQDAVVISLRTSTPGARGRGRVYWPAAGAGLSTDFRLAAPTPAQIALQAAQMFDLIGNQINAEWAANSFAVTTELAVRSVTDHQSRKVERLQVGDILDTQRRRRDSMVENYVQQGYPIP